MLFKQNKIYLADLSGLKDKLNAFCWETLNINRNKENSTGHL